MLIAALLTFSSAAIDAPCTLVMSPHIHLESEQLKIGDVVNNECPALAYAPYLSNIPILTRGAEHSETILSTEELRRLVRLRVPGLNLKAPQTQHISIHHTTHMISARKVAISVCYKSRIAIARRALISRANLDETPCLDAQHSAPVSYDYRQDVIRSAQSTDAGIYFGKLALPDIAMLDANTPISYSITFGSVAIERTGILLQPAIDGSRAFISDRDGNVSVMTMAIPLPSRAN